MRYPGPSFDERVGCPGTHTDYPQMRLNGPMFNRQWHAVVPAKLLKDAKSRLGREDLALPFFTDVISALKQSKLVESVTVVSADPTICRLAVELNCQIVMENRSNGILPAINMGISSLKLPDQRNILVVLGDLPCLNPDQVDSFILQGSEFDSAFVSDAEGTGSTMWMRTHSTIPTPHFGPRSRAMHRESGAIEIDDPQLIGTRRDVDTAVNLWDAIRIGVGKATEKALRAEAPRFHSIDQHQKILTISQVSPPIGVDENGRFHPLDSTDLPPLINPRVGQRIAIPPKSQ